MLTEGLDCFGGLVAEPAWVAAIHPIKRQVVDIAQPVSVRDAYEPLAALILIVGAGVDRRPFSKFLLLEPIHAPREGEPCSYPLRCTGLIVAWVSHWGLIPRFAMLRYFHM